MARKSKTKAKGNTVRVDFSDVSANVLLPEGDGYVFQVESAEQKDNDGDGQIIIKVKVLDAPSAKVIGKTTTVYFNLAPQSLWVLANALAAMGMEVPEEAVDLDLDEVVGLTFGADVEHREWNDKKKLNLTNFVPADAEASDDEDEEEEVVVKKGKKARDDEDEDEDEKPAKKSRKSKKVEEDEDEDEEPVVKGKKASKKSDDEDEEDEKPAKKGKASKKKKATTYAESEILEMDDEELEDLVGETGIDVDLEDYETTRKKRKAVIAALEEEGLLED